MKIDQKAIFLVARKKLLLQLLLLVFFFESTKYYLGFLYHQCSGHQVLFTNSLYISTSLAKNEGLSTY